MQPHADDTGAPPKLTRERMRDHWSAVAGGWAKWESAFQASTWPVTLRMVTDLQLSAPVRVLDVGCGIGDPALQIASVVKDGGSVLGLDLSPQMVATANARAKALKLENVEFRVGSVEDLNPSGERFDAVVARFTIMFFVDLPAGLRHLYNLLRPGGRLSVAVWASMDENPMFSIPSRKIAEVIDLPKPDADAPGPMRLSKPGELGRALQAASFEQVRVTDVPFYNVAQDATTYFEMLVEMAASFRQVFQQLDATQRKTLRRRVETAVAAHADGQVIRVPAKARVGLARRPFD